MLKRKSKSEYVMKKERYEMRFCGSGGQGVITAAVIFAEAAGVFGDYYVCQTQSYGPQSRGGSSKAEVIISTKEIDYPKVVKMDCFLAMNQTALDAFFSNFETDGLLIVDSTFVEQVPTSGAISLPFTEIARELGKEIVANIVALGAIGYLSGKVSMENLEKAVIARVPEKFRELNIEALHAGIELAKNVNVDNLSHSPSLDDIYGHTD
jgi:2-oxoglutarate ferredoxin oxidoreductase subunit gamma